MRSLSSDFVLVVGKFEFRIFTRLGRVNFEFRNSDFEFYDSVFDTYFNANYGLLEDRSILGRQSPYTELNCDPPG